MRIAHRETRAVATHFGRRLPKPSECFSSPVQPPHAQPHNESTRPRAWRKRSP
jgi:hypothetical protein